MTSVKRKYQRSRENMVNKIIEPIKYVPLKNTKIKETKGLKRNLHKQLKGRKRNLILKINSSRLV